MSFSEIIEEFGGVITIIDVVVCLGGISLFFIWLVRTSFGSKALVGSLPRRNSMPMYLPFVMLVIFFGGVSVVILITGELFSDLPGWQSAFLDNAILCIGAIGTTVVIVILAKKLFARRLKGFGLNVETIPKDFLAAVVNLISILPLVMLMIILTALIGKIIWGQDFQIHQHEELRLIAEYSQLPVRVLIIAATIVVVPVFEEMLFRGLFQTMIRSYVARPWPSIVICAALFAMVHGSATHWPALFVLAMCLGYSYEKSGSLFRPIFIHSFFNAISIAAALNR